MSTNIQVNSADLKDIQELKNNIQLFRSGQMDEERFKHYRLTRGVYGQRQAAVQMFRTKIPYGKITTCQLRALADLSDKYATGNLHITTRQNIQLHYVKLDDAPFVWEGLAEAGLTAREACGNTVRNITASPMAGIDPNEPFDVTPYIQTFFEFFLRNPICQDMGRKIKIAFSSSEEDSAYSWFHDFGFIPRIQIIDNQPVKGFKVLVGGGLGAQPFMAEVVSEFMPAQEIIPFTTAAIRVFDRYGEREKRHKARMKYLVKSQGIERFLQLAEEEKYLFDVQNFPKMQFSQPVEPNKIRGAVPNGKSHPEVKFQAWLKTNVFEQKQKDFFGVHLKVRLGDLSSDHGRVLADIADKFADNDIRLTINQGILLRYVSAGALYPLYQALQEIGLADEGFESTMDITACPGTDTCALGVTNSTAISDVLEEMLKEKYPELMYRKDIFIKISGCMNSCGQHVAAPIGLHGSSIKRKDLVIPAMQIMLGGGKYSDDEVGFADRIIKLPTRRIPDAVQSLLDDYFANQKDEEEFNHYYRRQGKRYFYHLLKHLGEFTEEDQHLLIDWGETSEYVQSIGVGECAGASFDLVSAIFSDARDKVLEAKSHLEEGAYADSIYSSYTAIVIAAKALLLGEGVECNTHIGIIEDFEKEFVANDKIEIPYHDSFIAFAKLVKSKSSDIEFAEEYQAMASKFLKNVDEWRALKKSAKKDDLVLSSYYKA